MGAPALRNDSAMEDPQSAIPGTCCHAHTNYCVGQSELKGEDVVFVEHRRPWPGSDLTGHSTISVASSLASSPPADLETASADRWLPVEFPPACPACGTVTSHYSLFCVFDGHNGVHAAKMAGEAVLPLVEGRLPLGCPPPPDHPLFAQFREGIQLALTEAVVEMNHVFAQRGIHAGCTATVVLQVGWLVTAAGLGDSRAVIDTGAETLSLSADHRVASHKGERRRVEAMGAIVAPLAMWGTGPADDYSSGVGPLRIWPGGLSISRAIGDFDVGDAVLPFPHVMQVLLPPTGARLLVGSDGVWDAFDKMARAGSMSRGWSTEAAPTRMIQTIVRAFGGLKDDTSLIVVDILPPGTTFPAVAAASKKGGSASMGASVGAGGGGGGGGGGCFCFGGGGGAPADDVNPSVRSQADASVRSFASGTSASTKGGRARLEVLCEVDVAGIMGLMPEPELVVPGWYTAEVGERLFRSATEAADSWRVAHEKRYARPPATPSMPEVERPRRKGRRAVSFAKETAEAPARPAPAAGVRRSASAFFPGSTADNPEEFTAKFGHYGGEADAGAGGGKPSFLSEPSVRAGRVYNSEASVRAGNAMHVPPEDPSVRLRGSSMEGSIHLKTSALKAEDPPGLAPVRVVKRTGAPAAPLGVPPAPGRTGSYPLPNDSAKDHGGLSSIGE